MDILHKYRSTLDYREILRILQKASSQEGNFLWQSNALGKNIINIHHFEIDFVAREVVVFYDTKRFGVETDLTLYARLDYRTSVFKVTDFQKDHQCVRFPFPEEIKTLELRSFPRYSFRPQQEKIVTIKPSLPSNREPSSEIEVRVFDISQYGLGLIVSEHNRSFLKNNRILWVTSLGGAPLKKPVLSEVVYISNEVESKFQVRKQRELKVGLKLSGVFPTDVFQNFIT